MTSARISESLIFATRYPLPATRYPLPATRYPLPATRYPREDPPASCPLVESSVG
jgi:hypothetical protein